jgi:hypothetical protein
VTNTPRTETSTVTSPTTETTTVAIARPAATKEAAYVADQDGSLGGTVSLDMWLIFIIFLFVALFAGVALIAYIEMRKRSQKKEYLKVSPKPQPKLVVENERDESFYSIKTIKPRPTFTNDSAEAIRARMAINTKRTKYVKTSQSAMFDIDINV